MRSDKRQAIAAPCGIEYWNSNTRMFDWEYPNISCNMKCVGCGFSPAEQKRRLSTGRFVEHITTHVLHDDNGNVIDTLTKTVRTLYFKKEKANA